MIQAFSHIWEIGVELSTGAYYPDTRSRVGQLCFQHFPMRMRLRRSSLSVAAVALSLVSCATPEEVALRKLNPESEALHQQLQGRQISSATYHVRIARLNGQLYALESRIASRRETARQVALAFAAGANSAARSVQASHVPVLDPNYRYHQSLQVQPQPRQPTRYLITPDRIGGSLSQGAIVTPAP